jgi:prophage maintenance system killer protein
MTAVELFLKKNGYEFDYTSEEAYILQKECYSRRLRIYGTYEEMTVRILKEKDNDLFELCKEFVQNHIL